MKKRIDVLLVEKGLCKSREKAKAQVMAGNVYVNGKKAAQPSEQFEGEAQVMLKRDDNPYVSRGGLKLARALEVFAIDLRGLTCLDIGASTGGFTDCMLKAGAAFVYAVDVGYGQFDWALRNDERVELHERTNARYLETFDRPVDFASVDVSFISLRLIFPALTRVLKPRGARLVTLIKPQFEAGRDKVGKKGVVRDKAVHEQVVENIVSYAAQSGFALRGLTYSPIKGPNGNIEYLAYFSTDGADTGGQAQSARDIVERAHAFLG